MKLVETKGNKIKLVDAVAKILNKKSHPATKIKELKKLAAKKK